MCRNLREDIIENTNNEQMEEEEEEDLQWPTVDD